MSLSTRQCNACKATAVSQLPQYILQTSSAWCYTVSLTRCEPHLKTECTVNCRYNALCLSNTSWLCLKHSRTAEQHAEIAVTRVGTLLVRTSYALSALRAEVTMTASKLTGYARCTCRSGGVEVVMVWLEEM